jgi:tetratricopeptide (TPR) repeat protein
MQGRAGERRAGGATIAFSVVPIALVLAFVLALGSLNLVGCADPTIQYHRQFDYLRRVGSEALEERDFGEARKHLLEGAKLAKIAAATDLEVIDTLTRLTRACRKLGNLDEALAHANVASQVLARHRLGHGGASSGVYRVGAAYLLERGRLEVARGDFVAAEEALADFVRVRGDDGGDPRESTEAQLMLGELRLALGLEVEARALFRSSLDQARSFVQRDPVILGLALFRVAESKLARDRTASAAALIAEARPDGVAEPPLRPGLLLIGGRIDVVQGNREQAQTRFEAALALLNSEDEDLSQDVAAASRAVFLASRLFDPTKQAEALVETVLRALESSEDGSPLQRMLAGRETIIVGRKVFDAGAWGPGLQLMAAGRHVMDDAVSSRPHDALVWAHFEIVAALAARGRFESAAGRCGWLVSMSDELSLRARALQPERLLVCGRSAASAGDAKRARHALGRALMIAEEDKAPPILQMELLLRLAALAHSQARDAEEQKLFDRVLPFVLPGVYEDLERLLVDAYGPHGRFQPSSAAARLGHSAARTYAYAVEAPQLQNLAEKLGGDSGPASR